MSSRRNIPSHEKPFSDKDEHDKISRGTLEKSDTTPAVPAAVIYKLLAFTAAMIVGPLGTYFLTLNTIFRGNSTFAGATAALMANVVLIAYVVVAMKEDEGEKKAADEKARKTE